MTSRRLLPLLLIFSLVAAACGSTSESVTTDAEPSDTGSTDQSEPATTTESSTTTEAETTTTVAPTDAPAETTAPVEAEGGDGSGVGVNAQEIYETRCVSCHGADGVGTRGPDLIGINETQPDKQVAIDQTINGGNGMPAFGSRLSPEEIEATIDYIYATF